MKTLRLFTLILSVFAICQAGLGADAKADPNINQAKVALRAQQYAEAVPSSGGNWIAGDGAE